MQLYDRLYGLVRSLRMYYGDPAHRRRSRAFYRGLVRPGDLCFDIGAHVGNRSRCWSKLGARVVAVEPQPDFVRFLRWLFRGDPNVTVVDEAIAAAPGRLTLHISRRTPTVSTGSATFIAETRRAESFAWVNWDARHEVTATTLDRLIQVHGRPDFVKIDVEGMEHEVLRGLSQPLPCLSFEFIPSSLDSALGSIDRLESLGRYRYNLALGEGLTFVHEDWIDADSVRRWLSARDPNGDSGDVYARLEA
ncbi:MAG: FkbM family methyltransferase [Geminicoccaceae bacterium]